MTAPAIDGDKDSKKPGGGAKNYLRKVETWQRLTDLPRREQAPTLYYKLEQKAWEDAESLDVTLLDKDGGMEYMGECRGLRGAGV